MAQVETRQEKGPCKEGKDERAEDTSIVLHLGENKDTVNDVRGKTSRSGENLATPPKDLHNQQIPTIGYVASVSNKRGIKRLHQLGKCYRRPGIDYREWVYFGESLPSSDCYDAHCLQCWRKQTVSADSDSSESGATTSSSTESD